MAKIKTTINIKTKSTFIFALVILLNKIGLSKLAHYIASKGFHLFTLDMDGHIFKYGFNGEEVYEIK